MKKRIIGALVCMLLVIPFLSFTVAAFPTANFDVQVVGGNLVPNFMHVVGGILMNFDLSNATYDVTYNITITGKVNASYEATYSHDGPERPMLVSIPNGTQGVGVIIITITISTSDGYVKSKAAKGIQLGGFTWVPLSWALPPILKGYIPWLDYHPPDE
ncbi:hypothetical protein AYK25_02600 [Thermoplasmatales archaeon SM1-50]|nr:MAG: hypothetical protein AYK25_02600 [Thermoplasmatales archaeon SM1-50]